jgi:hypothetical protein
MADEHRVTTPGDRPREAHDVLFQDELALLLRVSRATIERRRRLVIHHTLAPIRGRPQGGRAMPIRMRSRSNPNAPQHEPGLTLLNSEPPTSPTAYLLNSGSWDR